MRESDERSDPRGELFELIWPGGLAAQAVHVAAGLGLADHLAEEPRTSEAIAEDCHANPAAVERLLRALESLGLLVRDPRGRYRATPVLRTLGRDEPGSSRDWALFLGAPFLWNAWGGLMHSVVTGEPSFEKNNGLPFYQHLAERPDDAALYDAAMDAGATQQAGSLIASYDFSPFERIVDVGGGRGALLAGILDANPHAHGILYDLPAVVAGAPDGVRHDRCEVRTGDALDSVPEGGDLYLLKSVVHSLDDQHATRVLTNCRAAMAPAGRLLLIEIVLDEDADMDPRKALMDLMMLTLVPGRERTAGDFAELFGRSGFRLDRVIANETSSCIIEAVPM